MFDSLDEQMARDEKAQTSRKQRILQWALILVISVLVFGGLIAGVHFLE